MKDVLDAALAAKKKKDRADLLHRMAGVVARTGRSKAWIYAAIRRGEFPEPVRLGGRSVAWRDSDLAAWQETLQAGVSSIVVRRKSDPVATPSAG